MNSCRLDTFNRIKHAMNFCVGVVIAFGTFGLRVFGTFGYRCLRFLHHRWRWIGSSAPASGLIGSSAPASSFLVLVHELQEKNCTSTMLKSSLARQHISHSTTPQNWGTAAQQQRCAAKHGDGWVILRFCDRAIAAFSDFHVPAGDDGDAIKSHHDS